MTIAAPHRDPSWRPFCSINKSKYRPLGIWPIFADGHSPRNFLDMDGLTISPEKSKSIWLVVEFPDRPGRFSRFVGTFRFWKNCILTRRLLVKGAGSDYSDHVSPVPMRYLAILENGPQLRHVTEPSVAGQRRSLGSAAKVEYPQLATVARIRWSKAASMSASSAPSEWPITPMWFGSTWSIALNTSTARIESCTMRPIADWSG